MNKLIDTMFPELKQAAVTKNLSRRGFIVGTGAVGAGLTLGVLGGCAPGKAPKVDGPPLPEVNAWVHIGRDDTVTVRIARSEMGQGTSTGLAQLVAEELECDWSNVTIEYPTPGENLKRERVWRSFSTGGSQGLRGSHKYVREGGAAARIMLIEAAANEWGVTPADCSVKNGVVSYGRQSKTYGELAEAAALLAPPLEVTLKKAKDWSIIGEPKKRLDTAEKLTGALKYGTDLTFPGMLNASVKACPILGGTLKSYDEAAIADKAGVRKVVKIDDRTVAVIADTWWQAHSALDAMPIEWDGGEYANYSSDDVNALLDEGLQADKTFPGNAGGDIEAGFKAATKIIESEYSYPTLNHAPMEPMTATALWTADKCDVWCPTQNGEAALGAVANASGLPIEQCEVYKLTLGGGFGRKGMNDYVEQAVTLAKAMPGTHIKLIWSREEDQMQGFYHPITKAKIRGGLDADGNMTALDLKISGQSILAALMPQALANGADFATFQGLLPSGVNPRLEDQTLKYSFPNFKVHHAMRNPPIRPGFWRGVNLNQNAIYLDCFLDEMAVEAGRDPLDFRLSMMEDHPKMAAVLRAAAEKGGWGNDDGLSRGLACIYGFGAYVAACAAVTVSDDGQLKMHKITAATDPGHAVNPNQIQAQVEGSFVYGLSAMLYDEITYKDGQVQETNFNSYPSMTIKDMPEVETIIMPSGGFWGGVGEPTIAVAAPAVLNAIFAATGKRVRSLPIKDQNLRGA